MMWLGSRILGFAESSSRQRRPLPRFCSASFQSESPGFTVTTFRFAAIANAIAGATEGATVGATGAGGCAGMRRTAGGRDGAIMGGAAVKTLGRAKGERFTGG